MRFLLPLLVCSSLACGDDTGAGGGGTAAQGTGAPSSASGTITSSSGAGGASGLWRPAPGTTWQWQLADYPVDTSFEAEAYDVDLFETPDATISELHSLGRVVICYFSAGSWESFRPDAGSFPESVKGGPLDPPFADELWLDIRAPQVRALMQARLDLAAARGCDAVEPDNVDGYQNDSGFPLSARDQLDFNRFLASEAHARGLSVGLKNDVDQLAELAPDFDWALNEECFLYDECDAYASTFLAQNKAVFHAEYVPLSQLGAVCAVTKPLGISTLIKNIELDAFAVRCP